MDGDRPSAGEDREPPKTVEPSSLSVDTPIQGRWLGTEDELLRHVPAVCSYAKPILQEIAHAYMVWSDRMGIRTDVAFAQALLETNGFRFTGDVRWSQNNYCGLRLPDGSGYYTFDTPWFGVGAHVVHLCMHTYVDHINGWCNVAIDPKHGEHFRDKSRVEDLGKGANAWTPNPKYGEQIVRVWNKGV